MDPIKVDFEKKGTGKKEIVIPPEKAWLKILLSAVGAILVAAIAYYVMLPALNLKDTQLYLYLGIVVVSYLVLLTLFTGANAKPEYMPYIKRQAIVPGILIGVLVLTVGIGFAASSVVLRANAYSELLTVNEEGNFTEDIAPQDESTFNSIPRLDEASAAALAPKALGDLEKSGKVSQFNVYPSYTQINYQGKPVRVAPLQYDSLLKWWNNRNEGLPGYILIDMTEKESPEYVATQSGIKYSPSEHFGRLLKRHLRFSYPTYLFDEAVFEIDDEGNPYWVVARLDNTIGLFGGKDVIGIVLVDADDPNGDSSYYDIETVKKDADLQWLDRVYSSTLLVEQYNYYGKYQSGFWNSIIFQNDVRVTTDDHSYIALDDDVYLYTGVTSITSDQSIIGFILINQRTKDAVFYRVSGAKEENAQQSADGLVLDYGYKATFPLLINVGSEPTYFMALKDPNTQQIKQYALINVKDYTRIAVNATSITACMELYAKALKDNAGIDVDFDSDNEPDPNEVVNTKAGTIAEVQSAVINGTTVYYFRLADSTNYFTTTAGKSELAILLKSGDKVKITFTGEEKAITTIDKIERA